MFFCKTLQEISCDKYTSPERKVKIAQDLISAAAHKETALAAVSGSHQQVCGEAPDE
jgi:hypothetical protein